MAALERTVSVTGHTWATAGTATTPFVADAVSVVNMSTTAADVLLVSFDGGTTTAATLTPGSIQAGYQFDACAQKLWLCRSTAGAAVTALVVFTKRA